MMQKIFCLPKISIKDMQSKLKQQRTSHKKYNYEQNCTENELHHNHEIKITSPFYQRTHHKEKCQCQYHRMKRAMMANRKIDRKKQKTIIEVANKPMERISTDDKEIMAQFTNRVSKIKLISPNKLLEPLQNTLPNKVEIENEVSMNQNNIAESKSKSIKKLPTRKTFKNFKYKPIMEVMDQVANSKIDALNQEYIQLISHRLENQKFKQKYLKTLFGFIKMKSNQNKFYMYNSKAYIQNSLNMLLNHYSMNKLLDYERMNQDEINQIAYYMNCFPDKVKDILYNLGRAVSEMEKTLEQIRKKRKNDDEQMNKQNSSQTDINNCDQLQNTQQSFKHNMSGNLDPTVYKHLQSVDSYFAQRDENNISIVNLEKNLQLNIDNESNMLRNSHKQKYSILRSSSKRLNDLISNSSSKKDFLDNKSNHPNEQPDIRKSIRVSQKNQQTLSRSLRSTVLGIVDQIQKDTRFTKKKQTTKLKKAKLKSKFTQFDQKYVGVEYQKFITKKNFQNLISNVERLDQNDAERAQTIFKQLNIENFLDDHEKIQQIVKTFKPLFNEKSLHFFLRQIVMVRDKRYIQKLERQLDDMLQEIKKNDTRGQPLDFFQIKPEKKVPSYMNKMAKCREFKVDKKQTINHIQYFEAQEQIQRHRTIQQSVKMHLEQVELHGIRFDQIDPTKSTLITHSQSPKKQLYVSKTSNMPDILDQKKILRYMKSKHGGTFNFLASQFDTICRSLPKQNVQ